MSIMPFVCLFGGFVLGTKIKGLGFKIIEKVVNSSLFLLMFTIGLNVGMDKLILSNIGTIGLNSMIIAILAIFSSAILTYFAEKKYLHLENFKNKVLSSKADSNLSEFYLIPICLLLGVFVGYGLLKTNKVFSTSKILYLSLVLLYSGVGVSLSRNRDMFINIKNLGIKILIVPFTTLVGSIIAGVISTFILKIPAKVAVISAAGMSYYSVTGAYMTKLYGTEIGIYGFLVNVFREFFVVLLLPVIIKMGNGAAISSGAAGNMDTMLLPVTKYTGESLVLVTLITGTVLTFAVPFLLPFINMILCLI